jgi:acyl phosphate:glycerol-3-phosphate acyltransferase
VTELLIKGVLSYLLGSVIGSLVIRRLAGGVDIRTLGSGNPGATNAMRTLGMKVGIWVFVIDLAKGWIATGAIAPLGLPAVLPAGMPPAGPLAAWVVPVCGIAVMLGHIYPVWFGFRGGKGVATLVGAVLGISARLLVPMIVTWLIAVVLLGFVSLGSMLGAVALAVTIWVRQLGTPLLTFGSVSVLLILYTHRANIARLKSGAEPRSRRLWLLGARRGQA